MHDELAEHLDSLARDNCYRVDAVLKEGPFETTQRVFFMGANGSEQGPYVRKYLDGEAGLGAAYERIGQAQRAGRRFLHLPQIIDWYAVGNRRTVVMEHVRGETLADAVFRCDPSVELACDLFPRLCEAVRELHEGFDPPIIHRDLKPSNIMVTQDGLTVIDFGIARSFSEGADADTRRFGTRAYAPPEQFGYGQTDVRTDVYALGMLLYFCLVEQTPDARARRAGYRAPGVPEALRAVIVRASAFDPDGRYASVAEFERAFLSVVGALEEGSACAAVTGECREGAACAAAPGGGAVPAATTSSIGPAKPALVADPAPQPHPAPSSARPDPVAPPERRSMRIIERFSLWVGVVWDVLLILTFVLFVAVSVSSAIQPEAGTSMAAVSFAYRAIGYATLVLFFFVPVLFVLRDRRPLRRLVPQVPEPRLRSELLAVLSGLGMCVLVFAILEAMGI